MSDDDNLPSENSLEYLESAIKDDLQQIKNSLRSSLEAAHRCGGALSQAQRLVPYGEWQGWVKEQGLSIRVAQNWMRLYSNYRASDLLEFRTLSQAIAALSPPEEDEPEDLGQEPRNESGFVSEHSLSSLEPDETPSDPPTAPELDNSSPPVDPPEETGQEPEMPEGQSFVRGMERDPEPEPQRPAPVAKEIRDEADRTIGENIALHWETSDFANAEEDLNLLTKAQLIKHFIAMTERLKALRERVADLQDQELAS